jgi:hypothetical protein
MPKLTNFKVDDHDVKYDKVNDFVCLTDISALQGPDRFYIQDWLRTASTLAFIQEWELVSNPNFDLDAFGKIRAQVGTGKFRVSADQLTQIGCIGIYSKKGRYGGTYAAVEWAIHFANWLDPKFYLSTLRSYLGMQKVLYGIENTRDRFARELAAKNYGLVTGGSGLERIQHVPSPPHPKTSGFKAGNPRAQVSRRLNQFDADTINLALWGMTAGIWRQKFPGQEKHGNMRNLATTEELQVLTALQAQTRQLQKEQYNQEEKLHILAANAAELIPFFCDTPEKEQTLVQRRKERGW